MEIGILRDGEPAHARVTIRKSELWMPTFQVDAYSDAEPKIITQGDDLFEAVQALCRVTDRMKIRLLVNGARRGACRHRPAGRGTEHLVSFPGPGGLTSLTDVGAIFDPADASLIGTPDERNPVQTG
ncbi:hypothetical protein [Planobispora takensis]|uniref:Uncharacterized protein n=2 Tax=Planobispora takensis TaxID=1367882 RepID=A0A8J3STF7_9ACTN|nr:hypothetical protein Pta02_19610 [Planobispora takensis]